MGCPKILEQHLSHADHISPEKQEHETKMGVPGTTRIGNPVVASTRPVNRHVVASHLARFLVQVCIKLLMRSILIHADEIQNGLDVTIVIMLMILLAIVDIMIQSTFQGTIVPIPEDGPAGDYKWGGGAVLLFAYLMFCLPFATSLNDFSKVVIWLNVVDEVGCLVEMRLGLFQKGVDWLVDSWGV